MRQARVGGGAFWLFCGLLASPLVATAAEAPTSLDPAALAQSVTIIRDEYGVPHIDGPTDASVIFGFAYAQCEDYFWQVEDSAVMGLGRYAELYGKKELPKDLRHRAFEIVPRAQADFPTLEPEVRQMCEAFAAGVNYYLAQHPEVKPRLLTRCEPWMLLASARTVTLEMNYGKINVPGDRVPESYEAEVRAAIGSNAWALAPQRTKNGHALLFINPHQPYYGFGQFYEAHLRSGEGWNMSGATFFGGPLPGLGFNGHVGWAFTVNEPDLGDAWRVTFDDPANPLNYRYGDGWRTATEWKETVRVKRLKGFDEKEYTFRKTHHGPIVMKENDTTYVAANIAKLHEAFIPRQLLKMVRAKNLDEFRQAMSMLDFHIFNTVYADREGNIAYFYNGIVPKRDPKVDWHSIVDGSKPGNEWQGIHSFDELPQVVNPPSGYLQSCNQTPHTVTDDGSPALGDFPPYMVMEKHDDKRRAKVSRLLLRQMQDMTYDEWIKKAFDTTIYWAITELPRYRQHFKALEASDPALAARVRPYLEHLLDWDGRGGQESTQTTLCLAWYEELYGFGYPAETLKREFVGNTAAQFQALITAAEKLASTHGDWKLRWGDINRLQRHANVADFFQIPFSDSVESVPSAGLHGPPGVAFTMYFSPSINLPPLRVIKKHYAVVGASYLATVEFGPELRAGSVIQFGASGDPKSPHFFDQAKLMGEGRVKTAHFEWDDVKAHAKRTYHPGEEAKASATAQAGQ